jgi:serine protease
MSSSRWRVIDAQMRSPARLRSMPEVEYAELDGVVRAHFSPNDNLYALQWHFKMIGAERMWDIQRCDPSVAVAVLDSGVAYEDFGPYRKAPDFGGTVFLPGFNVFTRDSHANDNNFHGTHVASIIAEATNNGSGASGLAHLCAIMPVKVLDKDGFGSNSGIAEGIDYVVNFRQNGVNPVKVINLSLGGPTASATLGAAIDRAVAAGITVVASAGNDNISPVDYPARYENVIAVGSVDGRKVKAPTRASAPRSISSLRAVTSGVTTTPTAGPMACSSRRWIPPRPPSADTTLSPTSLSWARRRPPLRWRRWRRCWHGRASGIR